jgi:hypothetical protein
MELGLNTPKGRKGKRNKGTLLNLLSHNLFFLKNFKKTLLKVTKEDLHKLEEIEGKIIYPLWFGKRKFHRAHKSNLLRKDRKYYLKYFWFVPNNLPYVWPVVN